MTATYSLLFLIPSLVSALFGFFRGRPGASEEDSCSSVRTHYAPQILSKQLLFSVFNHYNRVRANVHAHEDAAAASEWSEGAPIVELEVEADGSLLLSPISMVFDSGTSQVQVALQFNHIRIVDSAHHTYRQSTLPRYSKRVTCSCLARRDLEKLY